MLKHLTSAEMIALLTPLLRSGERRNAFLGIAEIAALESKVKAAHSTLIASQPLELSDVPEFKEIQERGSKTDVLHDDLARALSLGLEAHAALLHILEPPKPELAERCLAAQKRIFPGGLNIINTSWLAEAGNAERVSRLVHEEEKWIADLLKSIPAVNGITFYDVCARWIGSGKELGVLEQKRDVLLAKLQSAQGKPKNPQEARRMFFRVVSAILYNLDLSDAPAEQIELVRGPVMRASDKAARRHAAGKGDEAIADDMAEKIPEGSSLKS